MKIRNVLISSALFLAAPTMSFGSISDKDRPSFGFQLGATFGGASVRNASGTDDITSKDMGFTLGVAMETPSLVGPLFLQPELNFSRSASGQTLLPNVKLD